MNCWILSSLLLNIIVYITPQCVENSNVKLASIDSSITKNYTFDVGHSQIRQFALNIKESEADKCTWICAWVSEMLDGVFFSMNINELGSSTEYFPPTESEPRGTYCFRFMPVGSGETAKMRFECRKGQVAVDSVIITINVLNN
jgi:hypothetical protein